MVHGSEKDLASERWSESAQQERNWGDSGCRLWGGYIRSESGCRSIEDGMAWSVLRVRSGGQVGFQKTESGFGWREAGQCRHYNVSKAACHPSGELIRKVTASSIFGAESGKILATEIIYNV
jgi:hypothetical protein